MHKRSKEYTLTSEGTYHVIPAGEFQPSSIAPISFNEDLDIWKNIMRESAEEILCKEEHDGTSGIPFNYNQEPYLSLEMERKLGNIKIYYLGIGLDVLTFKGEILTCIVYKEDTFNRIYGLTPRDRNKEGIIITDKDRWGRELSTDEIEGYFKTNTLAAG